MRTIELSCKDLMIEDWVYNTHNQQNEQVQEIGNGKVMLNYNDLYELDEIEPIPLTAEILEKNGWEKRPTGYVFYRDGKRYDNSLWYIFGSNTFVVNTAEFQIKYVHQLQHAMRLCGIEKEIIL